MIEFKMSVPNALKIHFAFAGLAEEVKDWSRNIWPSVVRYALRPWLTDQFAQQGHGAHGNWPALTALYAARKAKTYPSKLILEASGKMKESLIPEANKGEMTPRTLRYGSNVPYAIYHQTGTKKMVARRIFDPEASQARGTLKGLIRMSVARGVTLQARKLGFAVGGSDLSPAEAVTLGRGLIGRGGSVAEGM